MATQQQFFTEEEMAAATSALTETSAEAEALPLEDILPEDDPALDEFEFEFLDYEDPPMLLVDADPERTLARQKELMDTVFGGIGEEKKIEKRMGLAMQQLDIELRHALRLLLIYQDSGELTAHLQRCLDDPEYGYGRHGDNGRTIAQAMAALTDEETSLGDIVAAWLEVHREFQQSVLTGTPMNFLSMFEYTDVDLFTPLLQRIGDTTWRLGLEGEGQHRDFQGSLREVWHNIADTYVEWLQQDNDTWLADIKKKAARLPDHFARAAFADRALRKYDDVIKVDDRANTVTLTSTPDGEDWPRTLVMYDQEDQPQLGLSRLSGHAFYELTWDGGLHIRRFDMSSTSRNRLEFEHIELATRLAEVIAGDMDLHFEPVSPEQIEAAYLRRMKAPTASLMAATTQPPQAIKGTPAAMYVVNGITATLLTGQDDLVYATPENDDAEAVLLTRNDKRGVVMAVPVRRDRPKRSSPLMTTPLAGLDLSNPSYLRALCAWAAWLAWSLLPKEAQKKRATA